MGSTFKSTLFVLLLSITVMGCGSDSVPTAIDTSDQEDQVNTATFRSGNWEPLSGKETTGTVRLHTLDNGDLEVSFSDDFSVTDGPGLFVYLSNGETPSADYINLGDFKSNIGAQTYEVPDNITLDSYTHVLVHCAPYNVTFAAAFLS